MGWGSSSNDVAKKDEAKPTGVGQDFFVGQKVSIKGTGPWWSGGVFQVAVVDVRASDDTVKVQYSDGGYKRLPRATFADSLVGGAAQKSDYGTEAYEWYYENYAPDKSPELQGSTAKLAKLRQSVAEATRRGDFETAAEEHKKFLSAQRQWTARENLKSELLAAVQKQDFLLAHKKKDELAALYRTQSQKASESGSGGGAKSTAELTTSEILKKSATRALGGGTAGAVAMACQVTSLMWMRTIMNYQYRYGLSLRDATTTIYKEGGGGLGSVRRFYRGYGPALFQGPMSRFGDTAANAGILALLENYDSTRNLPVGVKTLGASACAATWRIFLTPVDTVKTILQVEGKPGLDMLRNKVKVNGPSAMYHGALATAAATFVGHYPWFATYNYMDATLPKYEELKWKLLRNAGIGFTASIVSDTVSNSLRVIKTYRQTSAEAISYPETVRKVIEKDGVAGLFGRGLKTRILANGCQGLMFSVLWKAFDEQIKAKLG